MQLSTGFSFRGDRNIKSECDDSSTALNTPKILTVHLKWGKFVVNSPMKLLNKLQHFYTKLKILDVKHAEKKVKMNTNLCSASSELERTSVCGKVEDRMICWEITEALPFSCGISFSSKFRFMSLSWWVLLLLCKLNESSSWFLGS